MAQSRAKKKRATRGRGLVSTINEAAVVEARVNGMTYRRIESEMGIDDSTASKIMVRVMKRLQEQTFEGAEILRQIQGERLERALELAMRMVLEGDPQGIDKVCKLAEQFSKLYGLYAPTKQEIQADLAGATPAEARRIMAELFNPETALTVDDDPPRDGGQPGQ